MVMMSPTYDLRLDARTWADLFGPLREEHATIRADLVRLSQENPRKYYFYLDDQDDYWKQFHPLVKSIYNVDLLHPDPEVDQGPCHLIDE